MKRLIGRTIRLNTPHSGRTRGTIVEYLGGSRFGIHLDYYRNPHSGEPITVDVHRGEFQLPPQSK